MSGRPTVISSAPTDGPVLSNNDFRRMLESSRAEPQQRRDSGGGGDEAQDDAAPKKGGGGGSGRKKGQGSAKYESYKKWQEKLAQKEEERSRYRDRASERRNDANPDYAETATMNYADLPTEATKFLGGDLEHTHLVKGLDFQLLEKVRMELERKEEEYLDAALDAPMPEAKGAGAGKEVKAAAPAGKSEGAAADAKTGKDLRFTGNIGKSIFRAAMLHVPQAIQPIDTFKPGHMMFEFDLDPFVHKDLPTTLVQSKEEWLEDERVSGAINGDVARRLAKSMVLRFGERDKDKDKAGSGKKGATAAGGAGGAGAGAGSGKKAAAAAGDSSDDDMPAAPRSAGSAGGAGSASGKLERKAEPVEDFDIFAGVGSNYVPDLDNFDSKESKSYFQRSSQAEPEAVDLATRFSTSAASSSSSAGSSSSSSAGAGSGSGAAAGAAAGGAGAGAGSGSGSGSAASPASQRSGLLSAAQAAADGPEIKTASAAASAGVYAAPPPPKEKPKKGAKKGEQPPKGPEIGMQFSRMAASDADVKLSSSGDLSNSLALLEARMAQAGRMAAMTPEQKARLKKQREREAGYVPDAYSEAYPETRSSMHEGGDSEGEEDEYKQMDQKKGDRARRGDFQSDEDWQEYNQNKEANPKAAFQFGVKMKDGRKQGSLKKKTAAAENDKFEKQWQQIQKVMDKDKGGGGGGGGAGQKRSAEGELDERAAKRQMILKGF